MWEGWKRRSLRRRSCGGLELSLSLAGSWDQGESEVLLVGVRMGSELVAVVLGWRRSIDDVDVQERLQE